MCHQFISLSLFFFLFIIPMKSLPTVNTFNDTITKVKDEGEEPYGALIAQAVDVQEIDVGWTRSKQLWKPLMARGVFGGQVSRRKDIPFENEVKCRYVDHAIGGGASSYGCSQDS
jgi:hypothetical protein